METVLENGFAAQRFQITYVPALPGKCACCGYAEQNSDRGYVDWGVQVDGYGAVVLCTTCLTEAGNRLGWLDEQQSNQLKTNLIAANDKVVELTNESNSLRTALRHYLDGSPGVGAVLESEDIPKPTSGSKRPAPKKSRPEPKVSGDNSEPRSNDSGSDNGDIISIP